MRSQFAAVLLLILLGLGLGYGVSFVYHPYKDQVTKLNKTVEELKKNLTNVTTEYTLLKKKYDDLKNNYQKLEKAYNTTVKILEDLRTKYGITSQELESLKQQYQSLQNQYNILQAQYTLLQSNYTELQNNYTQLQQQYTSLEQQYTQLQTDYQNLQTQYNQLQQNYTILQNEYNNLSYTYGQSRWQMGQIVSLINDQIHYALAEDDPTVFNKAIEIVGHGWNDTTWETDIRTINQWVANLSQQKYFEDPKWWHVILYLYDKNGQRTAAIESPYMYQGQLTTVSDTYYSTSFTAYKIQEFTFFPSDTLRIGGDCDDFATLQADLIEGYCQGNCETGVYTMVLFFTNGTQMGHAVTWIKINIPGGPYFMICDSTAPSCVGPNTTEIAAMDAFGRIYCNTGSFTQVIFNNKYYENQTWWDYVGHVVLC